MGQRLIISEEEKKTILGLHSEPSLKKRLFEGQGVGVMVGEPNGLQIRKEEPTEAVEDTIEDESETDVEVSEESDSE